MNVSLLFLRWKVSSKFHHQRIENHSYANRVTLTQIASYWSRIKSSQRSDQMRFQGLSWINRSDAFSGLYSNKSAFCINFIQILSPNLFSDFRFWENQSKIEIKLQFVFVVADHKNGQRLNIVFRLRIFTNHYWCSYISHLSKCIFKESVLDSFLQ